MFCSKCGRQVPDGSVCPCQQAAPAGAPRPVAPVNAPAGAPRPVAPTGGYAPVRPVAPAGGGLLAKFTLGKVIAMFITILTFGLSFINWYKIKYVDDTGFGPLGFDKNIRKEVEYVDLTDVKNIGVGDFTWLFVVVKVLVIINIVVFAFYLIASFINFNALVPAIGKLDISKLLYKAFFFILILSLIIGFVGALVGYVAPGYDDKEDYAKDVEELVLDSYWYSYGSEKDNSYDDDYGYYYDYETEDEDRDIGKLFDNKDFMKNVIHNEKNSKMKDIIDDYDEYFDEEIDIDEIESFDDLVDVLWPLVKADTTPAAGWYLTLAFALIGLLLVIKPNLFDDLSDKIKAANSAARAQAPAYPHAL